MVRTEVNSASASAIPRPAAVVRWRAAAAWAGLAAVLGGAMTIALGSAGNDLIVDTASAAEPRWVAGILAGVAPGLSDAAFSVALVSMLLGYLAVVTLADWLSPRVVAVALGLSVLALVLAPVLLSSDLFGYIGYGRLGLLHGLNPYEHGVIAGRPDPVVPLIYWQHPSSPYGPLFTLGSYLPAAHSLPAQVWAYKAVGGLALLCSVWLVWRVGSLRAALFVGANPVLLVYGVGGGHNDLIVMALVFAALALLTRRRGAVSGLALAAAVGVKVTGGLALPFVLLGSEQRRRVALGLGVGGATVPPTFVRSSTHEEEPDPGRRARGERADDRGCWPRRQRQPLQPHLR